jgi:tripartite-type tricarboxylate transporter receptor subunit TctC
MKIFPSQLHRPLTTIRHPGLVVSLALLALTGAATTTQAQLPEKARAWPERPIRLIVPYPAGGGVDIVARAVSGSLGERLGQAVVVDNRPGAGSVIGVDLAAKAQADGHTLVFVNLAYAVNATLVPKLPYDALRDLYAVSLLGTQPHVLVAHPSVPAKSVRELIALAQAKPGQITYASSGVGTGPHLAAELFAMLAGVKLNHIPYKGAAPAIIDVMGGQVQINFSTIVTAMPYAQSGRLQFLAVTSPQRAQVLPAVPTIAESGLPKYEALGWYVLMVRAGTPAPILARIHGGIVGALKDAAVRERLIKDGAEVVGNTPDEAARFLKAEIARWGAVVKSAGIKPE